MASNPYVNKVEYAGQTVMDLTGDTVTPSDVLNGVTFHDRSGASQTGSMITHNVYDGLDSTSTDDALSANQGKVLNDKIQKSQWVNTSLSGITCRKCGNLVQVYFNVAVSLNTTYKSIATLPTGYRPDVNVYAKCSGSGGAGVIGLLIEKSGNIQANSNSGTESAINGLITF